MHDKTKDDDNFIRIPMHTSTIISVIILPIIILVMLYFILFTECSYLLKNEECEVIDLRTLFGGSSNRGKDDVAKTANNTAVNPPEDGSVRVDIDKALGLTGLDEAAAINKIKDSGDFTTKDNKSSTRFPEYGMGDKNTSNPMNADRLDELQPTTIQNDSNLSRDEKYEKLLYFFRTFFSYILMGGILETEGSKPGNPQQSTTNDHGEQNDYPVRYDDELSDNRYKDENKNLSVKDDVDNSIVNLHPLAQTEIGKKADEMGSVTEAQDHKSGAATDKNNIPQGRVNDQVKDDTSTKGILHESSGMKSTEKKVLGSDKAVQDVRKGTTNHEPSGNQNVEEIKNSSVAEKGLSKDKVAEEEDTSMASIERALMNLRNDKYMHYQYKNFFIPNTFVCPNNGTGLSLIIGIHSRVRDFARRETIRRTWASVVNMLDGVRYSFIVGLSNSSDMDRKLEQESKEFRDIIQTSFLDKDDNTEAVNSVMFLKWVYMYCPSVKFLIKSRDDVFLNIPQIYQYINDNEVEENSMYGYLYENMTPMRNPVKKFEYVSKELYKPDVYPTYLGEDAYLIPGKFSELLFNEADKLPYFPKENILITGILAEKLEIPRVSTTDYFLNYREVSTDKSRLCTILPYCVFRPLLEQDIDYFWNIFINNGCTCFNFIQSLEEMLQREGHPKVARNKLCSKLSSKTVSPLY